MHDISTAKPSLGTEDVVRNLIKSKLDYCQTNLDEIGGALTAEMDKPIQERKTLLLAFLAVQREKFAFAHAGLTEIDTVVTLARVVDK